MTTSTAPRSSGSGQVAERRRERNGRATDELRELAGGHAEDALGGVLVECHDESGGALVEARAEQRLTVLLGGDPLVGDIAPQHLGERGGELVEVPGDVAGQLVDGGGVTVGGERDRGGLGEVRPRRTRDPAVSGAVGDDTGGAGLVDGRRVVL